jgi:hypothetical protein
LVDVFDPSDVRRSNPRAAALVKAQDVGQRSGSELDPPVDLVDGYAFVNRARAENDSGGDRRPDGDEHNWGHGEFRPAEAPTQQVVEHDR